MSIGDQLDEHAADLRNTQEVLPLQPDVQNAAVRSLVEKRSVSSAQVIIAVCFMVGFVVMIYFLLQRHATVPPPPVLSPLTQPDSVK